jgi:hypothetical protein
VELKKQLSDKLLEKLSPVVAKGADPVLGPVSKIFLRPL